MTRLDGEKKSPLPWIIGLIVLALLAAAIYYLTANKTPNAAVDVNSTGTQVTTPGANSNGNVADANATDANATDANAASSNMADSNAMADNSAMAGNSAMSDSNAMDANSAMMSNSATADANSAMMSNSATSDSNSAIIDNSAANVAMSGATPAAGKAKKDGNDVVATRSKTIETKNAIVTYKKSVKNDGTSMHNKEIVPKPVEQAKKMQ